MRIQIDVVNGRERERVIRLLHCSLNGNRAEIGSLSLKIEGLQDRLGTRLHRCLLRMKLKQGQLIEVAEIQSDRHMAINRVIERGTRMLKRQHSSD